MDRDILELNIIVPEFLNSNLSKPIRLNDYTAGIYIPEFFIEWERNILDLIPYKERQRHSAFINSVLGEVKEIYVQNIKDFTLKSILSCKVYNKKLVACEECNSITISKQNIINECIGYNPSIFLKRRYIFSEKYFLSYPMIRHVISIAHHILPEVICDFRLYHKAGILTLNSFQDLVLKDLKKSALVITNQFYFETFKTIQKSTIFRNISMKSLPRFMRCLTNVFIQQIFNVMIRSIDHIINIMKDAHFCPRIEFQLVYDDDQFVIKPNIEDVFSTYCDIIRNIEIIAQELMPLEEWLNIKTNEKYIKVVLPDWYVEESYRSLQDTLDTLFRPMKEYVTFISAEFNNVRMSSIKSCLFSLTFEQPNFDVYLAHINEYNEYLNKTNSILFNLYYSIGKLEQIGARESLRQCCHDVINVLTTKLVRYHQDFNRLICMEFEDLRATALDIPRDAQSLIELGEFVSHASKMLMKEQEQKICQSIYMLSRLLDITALTDEHIELNKTTINWLYDIQPIFAQNNTLCEAMKSELEEDLQRRINTLNSKVDATFPQLVILDNMNDINRVGEYVEHYENLIKKYKCIDNEMQVINSEERLFKFPETEFPKVIELKETIMPFYTLICTIHQWQRDNCVWLNGLFEYLDACVIERKTMRYLDEITEMSKTMKSRIKMDATANKSYKFAGITDDPDPMQQPAPLKLCWQALGNVNKFKIYLPLVTCMCNPALKERHWQEMSAICDFDIMPNAGMTLQKMIDMNLIDNIGKYKAISLGANKELHLQRELIEMLQHWEPISFEMSTDMESGVIVFIYADTIEILLREHFIKIEEMRSSYFVKPIVSDLTDFFAVLTRIQDCFNRWTLVQFRRLSLESIFSYPGITTRLNREFLLYLEATEILLNINNKFTENPTFQGFKKFLNLLQILNQANESLEKASRGVKDYIDIKRLSFTRFFFLEDSEVQKILFESTSDTVKRHTLVRKCFVGVKRLKYNKSNCISALIGQYGEVLHLNNNISMSVNAELEEEWLIQLEKEMRDAIRQKILRYYPYIDENVRNIFTDDFPSMVIICGFQLHWTISVERCLIPLNTAMLESLFTIYADHMVLLTNELRNELTRRRRSLLTSLIIIASAYREIIQLLLERNITEQIDFEWIAQLRYYLRNNLVEVSTFDTTVTYGYEYNRYRDIVNTPLTDRCFRIIMQAFRYHLYNSIIGPTDVGKTETIKSLTRALAKQFYTVNCCKDISYKCVTQVLKGVVSCGAWICFDNFNRLRLELLSAVAQCLIQMQQAVSSNLQYVNFEGCNLNLNISGNICVNINLESGYTDLPDNLKVLFRSVSMMAPDITKIAEIELFVGGFLHAKNLAVKLAVAYKLLSEYLGRKSCFSTSSMKIVIATAISMKRKLLYENEYALLLRSMVAINIPQLCNADVLVFQSVMQDCFPETAILPFDCSMILKALESVCMKRSLILHPTFKLKAVQIMELMHVRRALILIGNPLTGKTEILHTLAEALLSLHDQGSKINATVKLETIMPGVASNDELFGCFCDKSGIWRDGLCTDVLRRFTEDTSTDRKLLVFDGALSGAWIENLHTALDENEMLYLVSGERLPINESTSIVFETTSTTDISPSMISRCGIIYIDSRSIEWRPYARSHFAKCDIYSGYNDIIHDLFDWAVNPHLNFLRDNNDTSVDQELQLVTSMLNLFEIILRDACENSAEDKEKSYHFVIWAQAALILAIVWGMGGNLIDDSLTRFNAFCTSFWNGTNTEYPKPYTIKNIEVTLPNEGLIQNYYYIFEGVGNWKYWGDLLKNEKIPELTDNFGQIYILNINSLKYNYIFLKHIKHRKPFLFYGDVAVGKTCIVRHLLMNKVIENCLPNFFSFTSMITLNKAQKLLLSKLKQIGRTRYGPGKDQYCVNFIDDMNEATVRRSEAQSIFELLRQLLSYGYCYNNANILDKIFIQDTVFALAITAGRTDTSIPSRLLRHFNTYTITTPTRDNIFRIYSNMLLAYLKKNQFAADVTGNVTSMVNATIDIYVSVMKVLRPVPRKLYYFFDMRDVSKVINGCGLIQKESVETKITFIRLWVHEVLRVFGDRVLDEDDKEWLFLKIREAVKNNFKDSFEVAFDHLPKFENNQITKDSFDDLMFGNFMNSSKKSNQYKQYEEITSIDALKNKVLAYLEEYNTNVKKMNIVVCHHMLKILIKISRILSTPGGNILMISTVGSGRKSMTTLAAFMQQQSLYEITTASYYDMDAWKNNLRKVLRECGTLRKDVTYFINERRMKDTFLSDISCLLSTGELPDLFSVEDKQSIIEITRLYAQGGDQNAELSARSVMMYFADQCKNRLHFVLCFSPTNTAFRTYLCSYPNLAKHCTVNYYQEWPDEALQEIAVKYMKQVNVREGIKTHMAKTCVQFHNDAKKMTLKYREIFDKTIYVTSLAFLHMLKLYTRLISKKQEEIVATRNRYLAGLEKLELAAEQVEQMKTTLTILKPQLELSAQQTVITMKEVENENVTVERATILVKQEEEIANKKAEIAGALRTECEAELAVAIPILEDAVVALNTLKPTDITLVKAMKNPPDTVKLVMAAVCVMLGVPPDRGIDPVTGKKFTNYWGPSKRILGDMNFLQNLKDYDKDDIAPAVMQVIKKAYMTDNSFMPHIVVKASSAAEGLCKWVRAMVSYDEVAKVVAPKKKKLAAAQMECDEAEAFLNEKRQTLAALNAKLAALRDSLRQALQKKLSLETEVATCTVKLVKAEKLIASLGGEKSRWMQCVANLQMNYDNLAGDLLFSCSIIAYMASYNMSFRYEILTKWKELMEVSEIPYSEMYSFVSTLGVEIEINRWQLCGLSKNRFAIENAVILNNSEQWCLFIDPQNEINQWIKKIESKNDLKVIKLTDFDYMSVIEQSIEKGTSVLLENIGESLEIALDPILRRDIYENETWCIDIANKSIKYSPNFRFYITTRLPNPSYTADVFSKLTIIDFSMSDGTLRDKLLDIVVSRERSEFQKQFEALRMQDAINRNILQQQEENILNTLSSTTMNILEDENAIRALDYSKTLTVEIIKKQETARMMTEEINEFRDVYRQFADHCADLFCTLNTLSNLNHMYRFSFSWFIQLYITSIETSNRSIILEKRLQFLKSAFTKNLHSSVCRSLLERHKLLYSFLLCVRVLIDSRQITQKEVECFIYLDAEDYNVTTEEQPPEWLPISTWKRICKLSVALPNLRELVNDFRANSAVWEKYYNAVPFQNHPMPRPWADDLTRFQKLIFVRAIRRDKIVVEIIRLIENTMETDVFESHPHLQISESYAESSCFTPIVFILPSYRSPLSLVSAYASARGYTSKFVCLSMGDERRDDAEILVERTRKEGGWILLQNCHHITSWLPRLERICENLNSSSTSLDFRLWLSSRSTLDFPISVLQNSVKIAYDYPLQLKQTLLRIYRTEPVSCKKFFEGCPGKDKEFSKLLYGLCFFYAIVREREHFGPQRWTIPYEFNYADLEISIRQLQNLINKTERIPFDTLRYLIGECNYGGKITNIFNRRCLRYLLKFFCNDRMVNDSEYSFSNHIEHSIPQRCEYRDIIIHINNLQLDISPEVFNVDENAVIVKDTTIVAEFLESMLLLDKIQPLNRENVPNQAMKIIDEINDKLPTLFNVNEIENKHSPTLCEPLNVVLVHETKLINEIVTMIVNSLNNLKLALNGDIVITHSLENFSRNICKNEIPHAWKMIDAGIVTKTLSSYIDLLSKRVSFIRHWHEHGLPRVIRLDTISCCKRFLSAVLLTFSRRHNIAVEQIKLDLKIRNNSINDEKDAYYIHGLYLFGARWDTQRHILIESLTNTFWCDMPAIYLTFNKGNRILDNIYECPVYVSPVRQKSEIDNDSNGNAWNYITSVFLETEISHIHWIKRGVALFCQINK